MKKLNNYKELNQHRVQLDPLKEEDLEYIRELRNKNRKYFFDQCEITSEMQKKWWKIYQERQKNGYQFFVCRVNGERMGTVSLEEGEDGMMVEYGNAIVDEKFTGRGYFTDIFWTCVEKCGGKKMFWTVLSNNDRAIAIYKRFGSTLENDDFPVPTGSGLLFSYQDKNE